MNETAYINSAPKGYKVEPAKLKQKDGSGSAEVPKEASKSKLAQLNSRDGYDHWTFERLDNSNATSWEDSSPMDSYGPRWPARFVQTDAKTDAGYDHWTYERADNSNETTWVDSSPMNGYGVEPYPIHWLVQTDAKSGADAGYDHWTYERVDNSNETTWVNSSPMDAYSVEPYPIHTLL